MRGVRPAERVRAGIVFAVVRLDLGEAHGHGRLVRLEAAMLDHPSEQVGSDIEDGTIEEVARYQRAKLGHRGPGPLFVKVLA